MSSVEPRLTTRPTPNRLSRRVATALFGACTAALLAVPALAHAYIGPGAGFALVSSFLTFIVAFFTAFFALFTFPARMAWRAIHRKKAPRKARVKKVIILGLDGLEPTICEQLIARGELPNFKKLMERGSYSRLATSYPAMSPVAWSTFATGADASYHGIWDFLKCDRRSYLPMLSSSTVYGEVKFLRLGPIRIPTKKGGVRFLRKGVSFWKVLSDYGIFSTVLRVPITFPPEKINGLVLAGMDVPDLRGTMGTFTYFTQSSEADKIGGTIIKLPPGDNGTITTSLSGPQSPLDGKPLEIPITIRRANAHADVTIGTETIRLKEREYSPWVRLTFKAAPNLKLGGIARFYVTHLNGDFGLYVTPIHIDPDKPVMPITSPAFYSMYLAKLLGEYGTLGLAEDTWALNERVLDEQGFLDQAYGLHEERRAMWFHSLKKLRRGMACVVFDLSDRLQHMFFRYLDPNHPANAGKDTTQYKEALHDMYREMDRLLAETLAYEDKHTAVFVLSDHGFKTFQRGMNINTWLRENGYLAVEEGYTGGEYLSGVDWSRTKAFALGLGGVYLNVKGRERHGIVDPKDADALKEELIGRMTGLVDAKTGKVAVNQVTDVARTFKGPFRKDGPDLLVGFAESFRISWDCARGVVTPDVFEDNTKSWSGDHCIDPNVVPGILFSNMRITKENPGLVDLGPTVLDLFGIDTPNHMVGRSLVSEAS
jgi:predicted AlkP superfamily phosphohydrolase/phosphomutase